jgi:hypothetical protein
MTSKQWQEILLQYRDTLVYRGKVVKLIANNLGSGVVEVYKKLE